MKHGSPILPSVLLLGMLGGCGTGHEPTAPASQSGIELFTIPLKGVYVEPGMPLAELLERYTERMRWTLLASESLRGRLAAYHCGLAQRLEIPPESLHGFVEALVRESGLLLRFEHGAEPVVLQVLDPGDKETGDVPAHRVLVPASELPRWEDHPAHMITAQLPLPAGDTDRLVASLRAVFGEVARGQVIQTGDTRALLLSGSGTEVARLARILGESTLPPGTPAALPPAASDASAWTELWRVPARGLHLQESSPKGLTLQALLERYTELMGWQLLQDDDTRSQTALLSIDARSPIEVPPENVHAFVEGVLRANEFVLDIVNAQSPVVLRVAIARGFGAERMRAHAVDVPAAELPRWARHPDYLIRTRFDLPGLDAQTLSIGLRQLFSDTRSQQVLWLGDSSLVVTGYANEVASLSQLLRSLMDSAAGTRSGLPPPVPAGSAIDALATPPRGLHLEKPDYGDIKLLDLVQQYAQLMGWRLLTVPESLTSLRQINLGIALPADVPAQDVHAFVEGILHVNDYVLGFAHARDPVLLWIQSTNVAGRGNLRDGALLVPAAELPRWADHPGFLVTTMLDLPGIDARTLSNSLRQMFSDQATQQIIPLADTDSVLVTGYGADIAALAGMFRTLVEDAAGKHVGLPELAPRPSALGLLAPPRVPLHLETPGRDELKLEELLERYARLMGWRVLAGPETRIALRHATCKLGLPLDVPPGEVHAFVEGIARANELVLMFAHDRDPVLLQVESTNVAGRGNPKKDALIVPVGELAGWAAHPAFLISTCVDLPGIDVRTLSNSLRQIFSDQQTQQIIPVGNTNGLIVTGFASDVAGTVSSLADLSRGAAGFAAAALPAPPAADRARLFPLGGTSFTLEAPDGRELAPLGVLDAFAKWTQRALEVSDEARVALGKEETKLAEPRIVPAEFAYPFVGQLLDRARCTLSPVPSGAPVKWVVDVARVAKGPVSLDVPTIAFEELTAWSGYCATPFRTLLKLPEPADHKRLDELLRCVLVRRPGCQVQAMSERSLMICGTPQLIQAAACAILQACAPAPATGR